MAAVGCGSHTALILDRSGSTVAAADVLTEVEWSRKLDETSTARVVINPRGDCCEQLANVRSWRNRLAIYRNGKAVWDGPILQAEWSLGKVEIFAGDITAWLDRRVPHESIRFTGAELTDIATWLIEDAFQPDDPGHTIQVVGPTRIRGDREYTVDIGQTGEHLRALADTGLDYTAVGSTIVLLPENHMTSIGTLSDVDFPEGLVVGENGVALATRWVVHGGDDSTVKGVAGGSDAYYGLLERSVEETSVLDNASAAAAARSRRAASLPVPVFLTSEEVTLSPQAPVDVASLVPGWCVDVSTTRTCRTISQRLKIVGLTVLADSDSESVKVQLAASGADTTT